jgi:glycosyltransferase involved in cell wall biosynthesis
VIHAGHQREEFVDVMSLLDVLVFLVPGSDGSCRALLEAMSMATPGMVSSRGVLPDTVEDERTGRVIEEEPERFAKVLREFAHEPERWRAYGKAAREKILAQHSIDVVSEKLEAFYDGLIQ